MKKENVGMIERIRQYRADTGCSLQDAKEHFHLGPNEATVDALGEEFEEDYKEVENSKK